MDSKLLAEINNSMMKLLFAFGFISGFCFILVYCVKKIKDWDCGRFLGGVIYLLFGIFLASAIIKNWFYYDRFFWVLAWSFIAFAFRAFKASKELPKSQIPAWKCYPTSYLITLMMLSSLRF